MPKDATKNVDRYKIRGGHLNEFEYAQSQRALAEKKPKGSAKLIPGTPPEEAIDGLRPVVATSKTTKVKATSKATKAIKKATKGTKSTKKAYKSSTKGATAKKLAARKAAKK